MSIIGAHKGLGGKLERTAPIPLSPYACECPPLGAGSKLLPLYDSRKPVPFFLCFMKVFLGCVPWLHGALSCVVRLLLLRIHVFLV